MSMTYQGGFCLKQDLSSPECFGDWSKICHVYGPLSSRSQGSSSPLIQQLLRMSRFSLVRRVCLLQILIGSIGSEHHYRPVINI